MVAGDDYVDLITIDTVNVPSCLGFPMATTERLSDGAGGQLTSRNILRQICNI